MQVIAVAFIVFISIQVAFSAGELEASGNETVGPAAEQVEAGISPIHDTRVGTSSVSICKRLHWRWWENKYVQGNV